MFSTQYNFASTRSQIFSRTYKLTRCQYIETLIYQSFKKKEEGRRKKEEGRGKREEGRGKRENVMSKAPGSLL
ncbi:MAG: hypothetical protein HC894_02245 [Microcoleus sp. SM1_3_4]|nr:hypothetical protein [Microcoleus sp. SM1_3_4]